MDEARSGRLRRLNTIVRETFFGYTPGGQHQLEFDSDELPADITPEYAHIVTEGILSHLIENAHDALARQGGCISVYVCEGDERAITVQDNGPGVANPEQFIGLSATEKGAGRGRGLFLANLNAKALGGSLHAASQKAVGLAPRMNGLWLAGVPEIYCGVNADQAQTLGSG